MIEVMKAEVIASTNILSLQTIQAEGHVSLQQYMVFPYFIIEVRQKMLQHKLFKNSIVH